MKHANLEGLPEDVLTLVNREGSIFAAERAAGVSNGSFGRLRKGSPYTGYLKDSVVHAMKKPNNQPTKEAPMDTKTIRKLNIELPDQCPPLLAELIRHKGSKAAAQLFFECGNGALYKVMRKQKPMPAEWIVKAKAALGHSIIGPVSAAIDEAVPPAALPVAPPFVPWDGKAVGIMAIAGKGGKKGRTVKNVPQPLIDFVQNVAGGSITTAVKMLGSSFGTLIAMIEKPKMFTPKWQERIHLAKHGIATGGSSMSEDFDKYTLGLAIVMINGSTNFDRVQEIADILNGRLVFRKNTKGGWLIIYRMATEDLPRFKKLALRDANEVVCP